jgi:AcrR family transcriptional regulator
VTADTPSTRGGVFPFSGKTQPRVRSAAEEGIFAATEELLDTRSFADLTVADILQRSEVSRTTFYRYFTSKEMVVAAILESVHSGSVDLMMPWSARGEHPPDEALREALGATAERWAQHRPLMRACSESWHAGPEIGEPYVAMLEKYVADISAQIDRERKTGAAPQGVDSHSLALYLAWGSERMFYLAGFGVFGPGLEQDAVETILAVWMGAIYKT